MTRGEHPPEIPKTHRRIVLLAFAAFILVFAVWQVADNTSIVLYPFRLLVTFVHEAGHGLSAVLTGGQFLHFKVFDNGAGVATTAGGNRFIILQMGYLGAALFGAVLLYTANRTRRVQRVAFGAGLFFAACGLLFTGGGSIFVVGIGIALGLWLAASRAGDRARWFQAGAGVVLLGTLLLLHQNVALLTGVIAGAALISLGAFASSTLTLFVLNVLAMLVGFNAVNDIVGLWNSQSAQLGNIPNDALAVARLTNTPTQFWVLLWIGLALAMMGTAAYFAFIRPGRKAKEEAEDSLAEFL